MANEITPELKEAVNKLSEEGDADILVYNWEIYSPADFRLMSLVASRKRRKNVILFLITEGGSSDSAFRMMRYLQAKYTHITVAVPGWCKSAGTLMCIGAHRLFIGEIGELGPLDVQIVKADELDEQKSGLVAEAAFEKMQSEAFKFFMKFVRDIGGTEYRITMKTASDIAARMTTGLFQPILEKLDPVTIGEDFRSNRLAQAYAERLNLHSRNLKKSRELDALDTLLSNYPSHGFVIDLREATDLFRDVKPLPDDMKCVVQCLGIDSMIPRNSRQEQSPRLEFLNDEPQSIPEPAVEGDRAGDAPIGESQPSGSNDHPSRGRSGGNGTGNQPGASAKGSGKKASNAPGTHANG